MHIAKIIITVLVVLLLVAGLVALRLAVHSSRARRSTGTGGRKAGATAARGSMPRRRRRLG
ncbi:hypothetical protein ACFQVD_38040 [Streptosporangium amethystogenes subsp. fukuiense]|uniref:Uncharacterized protein n=1 Tax=Streptosporangium amethystogenes subsp. fukuiense TaxID=698418 RepID=A0ABW2TB41_9ACTN